MLSIFRRVVVVVLTMAVTISLAAPAGAAYRLRYKPLNYRPNPGVVMRGSGWGHGVGMSQYGAYAQAQAGRGHARILKHYYRGISVGTATMPRNIRVGLHQSMQLSNVEAVTGDVPWRACGSTCTTLATQPKGTVWTVKLLKSGQFRIKQGSTVIATTQANQRLIGAFNWRATSGGTQIKAYNPVAGRSRYKWGRLEYSVKSATQQRFFMVLQIPSMELYLRGLGEMPSSWGIKGLAALKAQAVAGRTYALRMHNASSGGNRPSCRCSLLATPANQAYTGYDKEIAYAGSYWVKAVDTTAGRVATYNGQLIDTYYSSSHGGRSENVQDSWAYSSTSSQPYLRSVDDPWSLRASSGNPYRSWATTVRNRSFARFTGGMTRVRRVKVVGGRTAGGTPRYVRVWGVDSSGRKVVVTKTGERNIVGISLKKRYGLRSQQLRRVGFQPFIDDDGSVHEYAIVYAYRAGIMSRKTVNRFRPGAKITRGEAADILYRAFRLPAPTSDYFRDDDGHRYERAINAIAQAKITNPRARRFNPDGTLTRAQTAAFFRNALGLPRRAPDYFDDDDGHRFERAINAVRRKRLMAGCGQRRFCPNRAMKRGPMATLLLKTADLQR